MSAPPDEFDWIAALRPLTRGAPAALGLMDDVAVLPARPGFDLVISEDAMVEGVHFLGGEDAGVVARRLLRTSLSDLACRDDPLIGSPGRRRELERGSPSPDYLASDGVRGQGGDAAPQPIWTAHASAGSSARPSALRKCAKSSVCRKSR